MTKKKKNKRVSQEEGIGVNDSSRKWGGGTLLSPL